MNDDLDTTETPGFWLGVLAFTVITLAIPVWAVLS